MSQTNYDVCLVVDTPSTSLSDLETRIGLTGSDGSHDIGGPHVLKSRGVWKSSVWQLCSDCGRAAPPEEHFENIARRLSADRLAGAGVPSDARVYVSLGVFSDAQVPTAELTARCLAITGAFRASIEVRVYSSDMRED
jgi:hypothetical protein